MQTDREAQRRLAPVAAATLIEEHPEVLESGTSARLRALASASRTFDKVAAAFEKIVAQSPLESVEAKAELAALYGEWADNELALSQDDDALAHLKRSHELKADLFAPMKQLAELLAKRGDVPGAAQVVQNFLIASPVPAEKERAQRLLDRIGQ